MSDDDLKATLEALEKVRKEINGSPEKARAVLVRFGFVTPDGKLTQNYRQNA
jgi:hypothetical protein